MKSCLKDDDKYAVKCDVVQEIIRNGTNGFVKTQNQIVRQILDDHGISEQEMIAHGSKEEVGGSTRLFYKDKPIAIFYAPQFHDDGMTIRLSQDYRIIK